MRPKDEEPVTLNLVNAKTKNLENIQPNVDLRYLIDGAQSKLYPQQTISGMQKRKDHSKGYSPGFIY